MVGRGDFVAPGVRVDVAVRVDDAVVVTVEVGVGVSVGVLVGVCSVDEAVWVAVTEVVEVLVTVLVAVIEAVALDVTETVGIKVSITGMGTFGCWMRVNAKTDPPINTRTAIIGSKMRRPTLIGGLTGD